MKLCFLYGPVSIGKKKLNFQGLFDDPAGLTGSEKSCLMYCSEMVRRGHDVTLLMYGADRTEWQGVKVGPLQGANSEGYDVVLSWNEPDLLRNVSSRSLRIVNQQLNDFNYCRYGFDRWVDIYTSPAEHHLRYISQQTPLARKWRVLPNGCMPLQPLQEKVRGRFLYVSSVDRGLHHLLDMWPEIKRLRPEAHLRIFYNIKPMLERAICASPDSTNPFDVRARLIHEGLVRTQGMDIELIGSVSHNEMMHEMDQAEALLYPCDPFMYTEGFSVSTMEACAAGCVPIITDADSLGEIYGKHVPTVHRFGVGHIDQKHFLSHVQYLNRPDGDYRQKQQHCRELAEQHTWDKLAIKLEELIIDELQRRSDPVVILSGQERFFFYNDTYYEPWDYRTPETTGIGGSETAQVEMSSRMASRGYRVYSFAPLRDDCPTDRSHETWLPIEQAGQYLEADGTWVVSRSPEILDRLLPRPGRQVWFVCQDVNYADALTEDRLKNVDRLIGLCPTHVAHLKERYPSAADKVYLSSNGINVERITEVELSRLPRDPYRLIWTSSPDRGLRELLEIFERSKEQVADLNLHIFYGMENMEKACGGDHKKQPLRQVWEQYERAKKMRGVTWHGRVNQTELTRQLLQASVWCYPTWFTETSCINVMEAQACGCIPITNPIWGTAFNTRDGIIVEGSPFESLIKARYVEAVTRLVLNPDSAHLLRVNMMAKARHDFDWERVADQYQFWLTQPQLVDESSASRLAVVTL